MPIVAVRLIRGTAIVLTWYAGGSDPDRCTHDVIVRRSVGEIVNSGTSGAIVMEALRIYIYNSRSP
ncbi:362_t:CDS:2 [Rhizophagus irregularis]|nr:362_t:CDS:2 [Rhizophagus irregularis]